MVATIQQQFRAARQSMRGGDRAAARAACVAVLKQFPNCLFAHRLLGWIGLETGSREAITHFQQCGLIDPEDALAAVGQAIFAENSGVSSTALQHFQRAAELEPDDERIREEINRLGGRAVSTPLEQGIRAVRVGDVQDALDQLRIASAAQPTDLAAKLQLARALWMNGSIDQAASVAAQVLTAQPLSVVGQMFVLAAELRRGRGLRVREIQTRAQSIDPGFSLHQDLAGALGLPTARFA